ncbi:MAG: hypothetical protein ACPLKQ_07110 [Candidatus Bathyarchaeales archaeon]
MTKTHVLSIFLAVSLVLAAFLGYNSYVLQSENLRLKAEIQSLSESQNALENKNAELQDMHILLLEEFKELNESYYRLKETLQIFMQNYTELSAKYNAAITDYTNFIAAYNRLNQTYSALNQKYDTLMQNYTVLSLVYQQVLTDYTDLKVAYASLNQTYYALMENYTRLEQETANYDVLLGEYQELNQRYQSLLANYTQLKNEYDRFYFALYEPLLAEDKVKPTINELKQWLAEDKTDELTYTSPDFVCGDYAVMLHMHAKLKRWDMGIVAVLGSLGGREFNHAFNAIICQEGLVYVEPQNDQVFQINSNPYYHPGFGQVYVNEFIVVVLYDSA